MRPWRLQIALTDDPTANPLWRMQWLYSDDLAEIEELSSLTDEELTDRVIRKTLLHIAQELA